MSSKNVYCIRKHAANRLLIVREHRGSVPKWSKLDSCSANMHWAGFFRRAHQCDLHHPAKYLSKYTTSSRVGRGWHCKPSLGRNAKGICLALFSSTENILKNYTLRFSLQRISNHIKKFWKGNTSRKIWDDIFRTTPSQRHFRIPPGSTWELRSSGSLHSANW
jgi:hypothetical protein